MKRPICLLVGAGNGLGSALAKQFAKEGFDLALIARTGTSFDEIRRTIKNSESAKDIQIQHITADASQPVSLEKSCRSLINEMGEPEILIYNVRGPFSPKLPLDMSYEELDETFSLEVKGAFASARAVLPAMIEKKRGTIIFSSATAAFRGSSFNPIYSIGKFGLRALSQGLAKAYAKDGVHVAHVRLDCTMDVPVVREFLGDEFDIEKVSNPSDVAASYLWIHHQPRSAWSNEVELRPYTEPWTY